ncbi:MAG: hypothetical protein VX777_06215 [Chlamydiota bacterium]|nr:hypothetical protein [Chlamydiota bacterium]
MNEKQLRTQVARLEFEVDQLTAELSYIDELLRGVGFTDGLNSVKGVAMELLETENNEV